MYLMLDRDVFEWGEDESGGGVVADSGGAQGATSGDMPFFSQGASGNDDYTLRQDDVVSNERCRLTETLFEAMRAGYVIVRTAHFLKAPAMYLY